MGVRVDVKQRVGVVIALSDYRPALALAELVLRNLSLSEETGELSSATFIFNMNKVFEDFVTAAFTSAMRKHGGTVRPQVGEYSLDKGAQLKLRPDIGWWDGDRCLAVLDAKYKAIDDGLLRHDDAPSRNVSPTRLSNTISSSSSPTRAAGPRSPTRNTP